MDNHFLGKCLRPYSRVESSEILDGFFFDLTSEIDTPRSLCCWILYENKEFAQLVNLECNPLDYLSAYSYADDCLVTKFLSKYPDFAHDELNPDKAALDSFNEFEELCKETNRRFDDLEALPEWETEMKRIFRRTRLIISSVIGLHPNLDRIAEGFGWGPGANTSVSGSRTSAYVKFKSELAVTSNCFMMGRACVNSTPSWANCFLQTDEFPSLGVSLLESAFTIVRGNEVVLVPKNAKTKRTIAKEPPLNSYIQKGIGSELRRLLRRNAGIDLNNQTVNQHLAGYGSLSGEVATLDLKGASDTKAYRLVQWLTPPEWFDILRRARSQQGFLAEKGGWFTYEKFSSMGNAYTFELETLIFYALARSVMKELNVDGPMNVYGDDIVIPTACVDLYTRVLKFAGFLVNEKKSFSSGPFRESCGKDYFFGFDVRPIFLKEKITNAESVYKLANGLRRYAHRRNGNYGCDARFEKIWRKLVATVPLVARFKIPDNFGDGGFISNWDESSPSFSNRKNGWGSFTFKTVIRLPQREKMLDSHGTYVSQLAAAGSERPPTLGLHSLRGKTYARVVQVRTFTWPDLGPWY